VVHHLRQTPGVDVEDEISGSTGLTGGVDGWMILRKVPGKGTQLHVNGRDIEEPKEYALNWDPLTAVWTIEGDADEVQVSNERQKILDVLELAPVPLTPKEVAGMIPDAKHNNVKYLMWVMVGDGQLTKDDRGKYSPGSRVSGVSKVSGDGTNPEDDSPKVVSWSDLPKLPSRSPEEVRKLDDELRIKHERTYDPARLVFYEADE
jgi:hypothetical protein